MSVCRPNLELIYPCSVLDSHDERLHRRKHGKNLVWRGLIHWHWAMSLILLVSYIGTTSMAYVSSGSLRLDGCPHCNFRFPHRSKRRKSCGALNLAHFPRQCIQASTVRRINWCKTEHHLFHSQTLLQDELQDPAMVHRVELGGSAIKSRDCCPAGFCWGACKEV